MFRISDFLSPVREKSRIGVQAATKNGRKQFGSHSFRTDHYLTVLCPKQSEQLIFSHCDL